MTVTPRSGLIGATEAGTANGPLLDGVRRFDHVMAAVPDLEELAADLVEVGLVLYDRPDSSIIARRIGQQLLCFADHSHLEVQDFGRGTATEQASRYWRLYEAGPGLTDWSVTVDDIAAVVKRTRAAGLAAEEPWTVAKTMTTGERWGMRTSALGRSVGPPVLPFLVEDITAPEVRAPTGWMAEHPNGADGIGGVVLVSDEPSVAAARLVSALAVRGAPPPAQHSGGTTVLRFGDRWITVTGADWSADAAEHLAMKGDGLFEISLRTGGTVPEPGSGPLLDRAKTQGMRLRVLA